MPREMTVWEQEPSDAPTLLIAGRDQSGRPFSGGPKPARPRAIRRQIHDKPQGSTSVATREHQAHSCTPIPLRSFARLPSVEARGRWRERGRMERS